MWNSKSIVQIYLVHTIILVVSENFDNTIKTAQKQIFSDVLKNISLANQILQELIGNYERIQDIYKSEEILVSESSDSEIDTVYKFLSENKRDDEKLSRSHVQKLKRNSQENYGPATAMIYDEIEEATTSLKMNSIIKLNKSYERKEQSIDDVSDSSVSDEESLGTSQEIELEVTPQQSSLSFTPSKKSVKWSHVKKLQHAMGKTVKTRFSIQNGENKFPDNSDSDARRVKKIVYVESFSPDNIWNEVMNKPIELNTLVTTKHPNLNRVNVPKDQKLAVVVVKNAKNKNGATQPKRTIKVRIESNGPRGQKIMLKRNILREAYGDACLYVAIRKCYKAMKKVKKEVCRSRSICKSKIKSTFVEKSKSGCLREFDYSTKKNKNNSKKEQKIYNRGIQNRETDEQDTFVDTARDRYLDTCIPSIVSKSKITSNITLRDEIPDVELKRGINILRDKYERKCKVVSSKKCNSACQYAYNETCKEHNCEKHLKKSFKKSCKRKCREAYSVFKDSSSDSDSSSDDESDSRSGSN